MVVHTAGRLVLQTDLQMSLRPTTESFQCASFRLNLVTFVFLVGVYFGGATLVSVQTIAQTSATNVVHSQGSSNRHDRQQGINAIPWRQLNGNARKRIKNVIDNSSFYRRLPVATVDTDPEHFQFLIRNPEIVVKIWQLMGVTQLQANRVQQYITDTDDGAGTQCRFELLYGNDKVHIYYGSGTYEGPVLRRKLSGDAVVVLQTQTQPIQDGTFKVTNRMDVFLKINNATAAFIAKTVQPMIANSADHNLVESLKFLQRLNQTARGNGPGVKGMTQKLGLENDTQLAYEKVIDKVFQRSIQSIHQGSTPVPNQVVTSKPSTNRLPMPTARIQRQSPNKQVASINRPNLPPVVQASQKVNQYPTPKLIRPVPTTQRQPTARLNSNVHVVKPKPNSAPVPLSFAVEKTSIPVTIAPKTDGVRQFSILEGGPRPSAFQKPEKQLASAPAGTELDRPEKSILTNSNSSDRYSDQSVLIFSDQNVSR